LKTVHIAVMAEEAITFLAPKPSDIIVDCTIGAAGHSRGIIEKILPGGKLIGIDRDVNILKAAQETLKSYKENVFLKNENFRNIDSVLGGLDVTRLDGALFDLGVSSLQLDDASRGFSFSVDGPLDMRMSLSGPSAADIVNTTGKDELADIIFKFGEERFSRRIAGAIVAARRRSLIRTTSQLADIVMKALPKTRPWQKIHPATRTFQALRIAVNDELNALEEALRKALDLLSPGGRICVISFHSLEDRIVKNMFKDFALNAELEILTKKPVTPGRHELEVNPRSRSAKLRAAIKMEHI